MTTIVLLHGPFADASSWTGVIKHKEATKMSGSHTGERSREGPGSVG
jgi:hypothetical protein